MKIRLNLATHPLRNRRFYLISWGTLALLSLLILGLSLGLLIRYRLEAGGYRTELTRLLRMEDAARREEKQYASRIATLSRDIEADLKQANLVIYAKSFPWSDFFSRLEKALPPNCYITSLNFGELNPSSLEVRLRLASPDFATLLQAITQLKEMGFNRVRVENENQSQAALISEVIMTYERID